MPNSVSEKELLELVKAFQVHRHSKTCRKYQKDKCRFNFGNFFTDRRIVAEPLPEDMSEEIKNQVLNNGSDLLSKGKRYIDTEVNPFKKNFYNSTRSDYEVVKTIEEIFSLLEISKEDYEPALSISEDNYQQMKSAVQPHVNKRECSIQECVYQVLSGQCLRKTFPSVIFANSNIPEKRYWICREEKDISQLPENSRDIFKKNMIDRYIDQPNLSFCCGKYSVLDSFCFAEFLQYYHLAHSKSKDNDYQPEILVDDLIENNPASDIHYPSSIPIMPANEKLKCRKVPYVRKYHVPNQHIILRSMHTVICCSCTFP